MRPTTRREIPVRATDLLDMVAMLLDVNPGLCRDFPTILSCGGINLKIRKVSKQLSYWEPTICISHRDGPIVRTYRCREPRRRKRLQRVMRSAALN